MALNKTEFIAGLQCEKHIFLRIHHPELIEETESPAKVTGKVVQDHARREFPDAILVERNNPDINPFTKTEQLLNDPSVSRIFEAAISSDDLTIFVDVLSREGVGWVLTEIKSGTRIEDKYIDDVAIQAVALEQADIPVSRYEVMHINNKFVYQGDHHYEGLFVREDITDQVLAHKPFIEDQLPKLEEIVNGSQPDKHIGPYCKNPYPCPFKKYCESHDAKYPVACLPRGWQVAQRMLVTGIYDIRDIPEDVLNSETHLRIRRITRTGKPELLTEVKSVLQELEYPRYFLDFESIQFAIPIWEGTSPYQQLPFQWSCHIEQEPGVLMHTEFLDTSGDDPRIAFAKRLLEACGDSGPIIVYNQSFEKGVIRGLADLLPEYSDQLLALNERIVDLLPVVRKHYYHPDMKGSWSIKNVLPCLVPELSYSVLGKVQDGTQAQAVYFDLIANDVLTDEKRKTLRQDMLEYCKLDTLAMVKIVEELSN